MSKAGKRGKSGEVKGGPAGGGKWDQVLTSCAFEEESWNPCVSWVVGRQSDDSKHIEALNTIVQTGLRKLFSVVTKDQLYTDVKDLGNPKNKKSKEIPANSEVCEACKPHLDAGEPIPVPLLAKLIKWKLMAIKTADIKRRDLETKALADKKKSKDSDKGGKDRAKSPKKGGKKTPEPQQAKEGSKLRKRGDEDSDSKYIDDEPEDGADHYILVTGFHDPRLFQYLEEINVNVSCVIGVSSQEYEPSKNDLPDGEIRDNATEEPTEEEQKEAELKKELNVFWKDLLPLLQRLPDSSALHDIARLDYEVKSLMAPVDMNDAEQKVQYSTSLFEDIAVMIYDLLDARRLYKTYLENLDLVPIPVYGQEEPTDASPVPPPTPGAAKEAQAAAPQDAGAAAAPSVEKTPPPPVDMRYYRDLMDTVPLESVSVPLIMNAMLDQVVACEEGLEPPSERPPPNRSDGLNFNLASYLSSMAFKLGLSEKEHQALSQVLDLPASPPELPSPPELINIQDDISNRTQHLKPIYGFDPAAIERAMLQFLPFAHMCQVQRPSSAENRQRAARLQELLHFCASEGLSKSEIDRAFKQFVFESLDLASTDANGFILEREKEGLHQSAIPYDDPYPFYKIMIPVEKNKGEISAVSTPEEERSGACTPDQGTKAETASNRSSRKGSADSKKGILMNNPKTSISGTPSPKRSRSNSVHFSVGVTAEEAIVDGADAKTGGQSIEEVLMEIVDVQKRNLDQWCFAEHFKPVILHQILQEASYYLPFVETYHHKRDGTLMVVLHNPYGADLQNHVDWHVELHSNVGFRNYLEFTAERIVEWLKEKEAEYQAVILSKEVEGIQKEEEDKAKAAIQAEKKTKSPRKSPTRSKSPKAGSRSSSQERPGSASSNPYVRPGSLKAYQMEQDKLAAEEEEKEKAKLDKRTKSAQKREKEEKEKLEKAKSPRGSAKSRQSKSDLDASTVPAPDAASAEESKEEEKFWPFSGYNTGNQLIQVSGITTTLFPCDGGQIKTERTEFAQGTTAIRSTVLKDGHVFSLHILNPREDMGLPEDYESNLRATETTNAITRAKVSTADKSETERSEKEEIEKDDSSEKEKTEDIDIPVTRPAVSQFGSVTAQLSDGMILALSQFGPNGESYLKPYEPTLYIPPVVQETPSLPQVTSPSKSKKDASKKSLPTPEPEKLPGDEEIVEEEKKDAEKPLPKQDFQELFVTCPDGLSIKYFLQSSIGVSPSSSEERQLAVRQSYPFKTKGKQDCESARRKYIQTEVSRVITADGNVIKNMVDGSVEVLSADGTVSVFTGQWANPSSRATSPTRSVKSPGPDGTRAETPSKKAGRGSAGKHKKAANPEVEQEEEVKLTQAVGNWVITYPTGERMRTVKDTGECNELASVPICLATDPDTQQTMATRDDHVITISYPDGTTVVEHADGTRITVYYRETSVANEDSDEDSSPEMIMQTLKFVKVECPAFATVEFNTTTSENLTVFGSGTSINVFPDGYYILHHSRGGRIEVDTEGTMVYFPRRSSFLEHMMPERELQYVLRHNADVVVETVDPEGNVFNVRSTGDYHVIPIHSEEALSDDSDEQRESKVVTYGQHAPRFFIIHADGSGTELLRYQDIAEYLMMSEQNPATAVLKDMLPDHPGVTGITILKPYLSGLSEKWLKTYDQESIVPQGIRCRDLKSLPSREYKKSGPKFGTNVGQGMSIGAATKGPVRIPILKCPNKLELRQLVQYKPVSSQLREKLTAGLEDYAKCVVGRMSASNLMNIEDPRSEDEKILSQDLKSLAELQRPEPRECDPDHVKSVYEKAVSPPPPSPPATPQPKRTFADWERDRRELEEENEAKKKLMNKTIGPYFDSELGKAFLLTQASDMDEMIRQLSDDPRVDGSEAVRGETNSRLTYTHSPGLTQALASHPGASVLSDRSVTSDSPGTNAALKNGQDTPMSFTGMVSEAATVTPTGGVRPHNPTPAHAGGQGSPAPLRPKNPTPAHAGKVVTDRPGNPTPKIALGVETPSEYEPSIARGEYPMILEHPWEEEGSPLRQGNGERPHLRSCSGPDTEMKSTDRELNHLRSLTTNVIGEPRTESVALPLSIKGGRPGAQPNSRVEDPVRRQVKNSLVAGANLKGQEQLMQMRGLICQPEGVNFGVLKEGCTYAFTLTLKNTGVDTCRFKVRQPPPATGLRVIYKPGPIAAGMSVDLSLELYAIANGVEGESGVGSLGHVLEIVTETDLLEVPIVATILTAHEFDNPARSILNGVRETSSRLVSTHPPASSGIIRPRRDLNQSGMA